MQSELTAAMQAAGLPVPSGPERWSQALAALKGVWASKYNERAYLSLKKVRTHDWNAKCICQNVGYVCAWLVVAQGGHVQVKLMYQVAEFSALLHLRVCYSYPCRAPLVATNFLLI